MILTRRLARSSPIQLPRATGTFVASAPWWIIPLTIITLGVYPSYWLYSRVKTLNALVANDAIAEGLPLAGLLLNGATLIVALVNEAYPNLIGMPLIALFVKLAFFIVNLVCVFSFRDELHEHPDRGFREVIPPERTGDIFSAGALPQLQAQSAHRC
jgi:hypothetical protein